MNKSRRKVYIIDRHLQYKYAGITIAMLLGYTLILLTMFFAPAILTLALDRPPEEKMAAARVLLLLHGSVWPGIALAIASFAGLSLIVTHRLAGPIYRLKKSLAAIAEGDITLHVKLRQGDDLQDMAAQINLLCTELRDFVGALHRSRELLDEQIATLKDAVTRGVLDDAAGQAALRRLTEEQQRIAELLDRYHLPEPPVPTPESAPPPAESP